MSGSTGSSPLETKSSPEGVTGASPSQASELQGACPSHAPKPHGATGPCWRTPVGPAPVYVSRTPPLPAMKQPLAHFIKSFTLGWLTAVHGGDEKGVKSFYNIDYLVQNSYETFVQRVTRWKDSGKSLDDLLKEDAGTDGWKNPSGLRTPLDAYYPFLESLDNFLSGNNPEDLSKTEAACHKRRKELMLGSPMTEKEQEEDKKPHRTGFLDRHSTRNGRCDRWKAFHRDWNTYLLRYALVE